MNEQTTKLIQELADKLGTTAEHLWGVLVRQAPIAATWGIIELFIDVFIAISLWKICHLLTCKAVKLDGECYDNEVALFGIYAAASIFGLIALLFSIGFVVDLAGVPTLLSGFLNPEYWAFKQIVK